MASATMMGRLQAILGLDTRGFERGLDGARGRVGTFSGEIRTMAAGIAAALTASIGSLGGVAAATIGAADEIQRLSRLANATPEEFQGWAAGAASVGIEQDKLSDILKDTSDRVGEFLQTGGGEMKDFFEKIAPRVGVTAKQFAGLSGPQALQLYVSTLQKAGVNQQEMVFYMESMADEATGLIPLLRDNGAQMQAMAEKSKALGATMSADTIAKLAAGRQSLRELGLAMTGIRNMIADQVVPAFVSMASALVNAMQAGQPLGDFIRGMIAQIPRLISYISGMALAFGAWRVATVALRVATSALTMSMVAFRAAMLRTGIGVIVVALGEAIHQTTQFAAKVGGLGNAWTLVAGQAKAAWGDMKAELYYALADMSAEIGEFINGTAGLFNSVFGTEFSTDGNPMAGYVTSFNTSANDAATEADTARRSLEGLRKEFAAGAAAAEDASSAASTLGDSLGDGSGGAAAKVSKATDVLKRLREEYTKARETFGMTDAQVAAWEAMREAKVKPTSATGKEITSLTESIDSMKRLREATDGVSQSAKGAFSGILNGAQTLQEGLAGILNNIANMLINAGLSSIWSSLGGTGIGKSLGGLFSSLIGANANGTENWGGGLTWVGERGRELVDLPRGSRVISNERSEQIARGAGPASMTVEVNPSPYFNAVVDQRAAGVAAPMVRDSARAQRLSYAQMQHHLDQRGTMT